MIYTCRLFRKSRNVWYPDGWVGPKLLCYQCYFRTFRLELDILDPKNIRILPVVAKLLPFEVTQKIRTPSSVEVDSSSTRDPTVTCLAITGTVCPMVDWVIHARLILGTVPTFGLVFINYCKYIWDYNNWCSPKELLCNFKNDLQSENLPNAWMILYKVPKMYTSEIPTLSVNVSLRDLAKCFGGDDCSFQVPNDMTETCPNNSGGQSCSYHIQGSVPMENRLEYTPY